MLCGPHCDAGGGCWSTCLVCQLCCLGAIGLAQMMMGLVVCSMMWCQPGRELESVIVIVVVAEEGKVKIWNCGGWGEVVHSERMDLVWEMVCM